MTDDVHKRAEGLMAQAQVEGISEAEREWLDTHLESCARCAERAAAFERAIRSLRSVSVQIEPEVIKATRLRVHLRAAELREHQARTRAIAISCALSWGFGVLSAPLAWEAFRWIGQQLALPDSLWRMAFFLWWTIPTAAVAAILGWWQTRAARENGHAVIMRR